MALSVIKESKLLARHSVVYGLGNFLNRIVSFLLIPVYTRFLTPNDYGIKELVGLSTDVLGILLATAISSAIYRFYFEYESEKDRSEVISTSIIAIGGAGLTALAILLFFTRNLAGLIVDNSDLSYFFTISFVSMWFQSLNDVGYNYLRANQKSLRFVVLSFLKMAIAIGLNIYTVCFLKIGVLGILISTLASAVFMTLVLVIPMMIKIRLQFSAEKFKEMLKYGLPIVPSQFGAFIVHLSDRFFLKAYCSIADTGLYSLGYRFGTLPANFISDPFNQTWQPRRFEISKQEGAERVFGRIFTYFLFLISFAGLGVSALTLDVLKIIADPKFWPAYKVVPVIVLASTIFTFHYHLNMGILIAKKTKYLAYINFSNGVVVTGLNFLLIPRYGVYGAAYATLIAFIYKITLTYYFSSRYYKIYFEFMRILKILVSAAFVYAATLLIDVHSVYLNFLYKFLIIMLYPIILYLLRFYSAEELVKVKLFCVSLTTKLKLILRTQQAD